MATLTPKQVKIVKSTAPVLKARGRDITTHFYATMLSENPSLNSFFNQANQANHNSRQPLALASALYSYAATLDGLGMLSPVLEKICHKHTSLHVQPAQYEMVGKYLLNAMADVLGAALSPDVLEAWRVAYWQLAGIMIGREQQLYDEADGWTNWRDFRIGEKVVECSEITSFYLEPVDAQPLPSFWPGQYISVLTEVPKLQYRQARQYSLSDAPNARYYRISVKKETGVDPTNPDNVVRPGFVSNILHDEKEVGDIIQVSRPRGEFFLDPSAIQTKPIVLLSVGVGITPQLAIVRTLVSSKSENPISFVHGARSSASRPFYSQLRDLAARYPNVRYTSLVKKPEDAREGESTECDCKGRLNLEKLDREKDLFLSDRSTEYFVCGPEGFMADTEAGLLAKGVDGSRIHLELFGTGMPMRAQ